LLHITLLAKKRKYHANVEEICRFFQKTQQIGRMEALQQRSWMLEKLKKGGESDGTRTRGLLRDRQML
jgi:hypothetical protein